MDQGTHRCINSAKGLMLADVLERYMNEVTPSKRGAQREAEGIRLVLRQKFAAHSMTKLTPSVVAAYATSDSKR
jgi:hypothetical protein